MINLICPLEIISIRLSANCTPIIQQTQRIYRCIIQNCQNINVNNNGATSARLSTIQTPELASACVRINALVEWQIDILNYTCRCKDINVIHVGPHLERHIELICAHRSFQLNIITAKDTQNHTNAPLCRFY